MTTITTAETLQTEFEEALFEWIAETVRPFHMVEYKPFEEVSSVATRYFTVSSRRTIQRRVLKGAENIERPLKM